MNKKQLIEFREEVDKVVISREALGEFDANSKYMIFILKNMRTLVQHAIDTYPKGTPATIVHKGRAKPQKY